MFVLVSFMSVYMGIHDFVCMCVKGVGLSNFTYVCSTWEHPTCHVSSSAEVETAAVAALT